MQWGWSFDKGIFQLKEKFKESHNITDIKVRYEDVKAIALEKGTELTIAQKKITPGWIGIQRYLNK